MENRIQKTFLLRAIKQHTKKSEAISDLADLLCVGKDAIYRRVRGETILSLDEIELIAQKYQISVDEILFENNTNVFFSFNSFKHPISQLSDYFEEVNSNLDIAMSQPNIRIHYATAEIPMFYYCFFPQLMYFKLYIWGRTVWNLKYLDDLPYSASIFAPDMVDTVNLVCTKYCMLPSTELWCLNVFDNTLSQIEFVLNNGWFANNEDALMLCDILIKLSKHMKNMAANGKKFAVGSSATENCASYEIYHNELIYSNNTILMCSDVANAVFSTYDSPNFLTTTDPKIVEHMRAWFDRVKNKSNLISEVSEKNRNLFFNRLERKVERSRSRIKVFLED